MLGVIVIDDENDVAEVLCEFLKINDIKVLGKGKNGKEAFHLYKKLNPDLVLMDLVMPDFDGFYGIQKIRQYDSKSKIIIVSASLTPSYVEKLLQMNVDAILLKPYDLKNIIEIVYKVNQGIKVEKVPLSFAKNN